MKNLIIGNTFQVKLDNQNLLRKKKVKKRKVIRDIILDRFH